MTDIIVKVAKAVVVQAAVTTAKINAAVSVSGGVRGRDGVAANSFFEHTQAVAATVWTINHALGFRPSVEVFDNYGDQIEGDVVHLTTAQCRVTFSYPTTGTAIFS